MVVKKTQKQQQQQLQQQQLQQQQLQQQQQQKQADIQKNNGQNKLLFIRCLSEEVKTITKEIFQPFDVSLKFLDEYETSHDEDKPSVYILTVPTLTLTGDRHHLPSYRQEIRTMSRIAKSKKKPFVIIIPREGKNENSLQGLDDVEMEYGCKKVLQYNVFKGIDLIQDRFYKDNITYLAEDMQLPLKKFTMPIGLVGGLAAILGVLVITLPIVLTSK